MITSKLSPVYGASALLLTIALAGCASGPTPQSAQLRQQIETASTGAEHGALATYYVTEAAAARASATEHRSRAQKYPASSGPRGGPSLRAHCISIANNFDGIATEFEGLAADHRALAGLAKT